MSHSEEHINPQDLNQLLQLLHMAQSPDNQTQTQVYNTLKQLEETPISYLYLAHAFHSPSNDLSIRVMAGLTMSAALKRNSFHLHFQPGTLTRIKQLVFSSVVDHEKLTSPKCMIISSLVTLDGFDYQMFSFLIKTLATHPQNITMVNTILQDLKFNNQNFDMFQQPPFLECLAGIYQVVLAGMVNPTVQQLNQDRTYTMKLQCINLITFHCTSQLYKYLQEYVNIISQVLSISQTSPTNPKVIEMTLQGLNQIAATKYHIIPKQLITYLIHYQPQCQNPSQILKIWTNLMIDFIENDDGQTFAAQLPTVVPRAIKGLTFTHADQRNVKEQMEVQYNPYTSKEDNQQSEDGQSHIFEASYGATSGYTLRKLSFQLIEKISIHYSENLWRQWGPKVTQTMYEPSQPNNESVLCFIGIISETCMYDMGPQLQGIFTYLVDRAINAHSSLMRATSLYVTEKLFQLIKENGHVVKQCLEITLKSMLYCGGEGTHTTHSMLKEAAVSLLDEILSEESSHSFIGQDTLQAILSALIEGLTQFKGRALFSVFKAISSIFEHKFFDSILTTQLSKPLIEALCKKWGLNTRNDSVMCPLLECMITGCQSKRPLFSPYYCQFIQQLVPLLVPTERKQLVLRCIDFLSSLSSSGRPQLAPFLTNEVFIGHLLRLLREEEKEIRHFTYSLVSDIGKKYDLSTWAQQLVSAVAGNLDKGSLTSLNNALTCLTDLLSAYPTLQTHLVSVIDRTVTVFKTHKLQSIFALNFARIFGRLALLGPSIAKDIFIAYPQLVSWVFMALRSRQVEHLTNQAFKGLIATLNLFSFEEIRLISDGIECILQSFVCYPVRDHPNDPQAQTLLNLFITFTRSIRQLFGQQFWSNLLSRPMFLPGAVRTLQSWAS